MRSPFLLRTLPQRVGLALWREVDALLQGSLSCCIYRLNPQLEADPGGALSVNGFYWL